MIYVIPVITWPRTVSGQTFQKNVCKSSASSVSKQKRNCFWLSKTRRYFMFTYNLTGLCLCCILVYSIDTTFKTSIHQHVSIILHIYKNVCTHVHATKQFYIISRFLFGETARNLARQLSKKELVTAQCIPYSYFPFPKNWILEFFLFFFFYFSRSIYVLN